MFVGRFVQKIISASFCQNNNSMFQFHFNPLIGGEKIVEVKNDNIHSIKILVACGPWMLRISKISKDQVFFQIYLIINLMLNLKNNEKFCVYR